MLFSYCLYNRHCIDICCWKVSVQSGATVLSSSHFESRWEHVTHLPLSTAMEGCVDKKHVCLLYISLPICWLHKEEDATRKWKEVLSMKDHDGGLLTRKTHRRWWHEQELHLLSKPLRFHHLSVITNGIILTI